MATTAQKTAQYTNIVASPPVMNGRPGMMTFQPFNHAQSGAGDDGSTVDLWVMPAGSRLYLTASIIDFTAFGASRVLKLGWAAHTDPDGTAHAADDDALFSALDVSSAGYKHFSEATQGVGVEADGTHLFKAAALLTLTCTGGTWPDAAKIMGYLAYAPGGP